jgi:predicted RNase H-like nuclease (RuvC/YqgF family)
MTEIKDHKTFWKRSTMEIITYTEGSLADIIQLARKDILSLITTIESQQKALLEADDSHDKFVSDAYNAVKKLESEVKSQKEEIEKLESQVEWQVEKTSQNLCIAEAFEKENESLKAITELAVKVLEQARDRFSNFKRNWDCDSHSDISKYNIPCRRCESIKLRELIDTTLNEIERLQNG